jgi:hypothetical protein
MTEAAQIAEDHEHALRSMNPDQLLAMARELLATAIRDKAQVQGVFTTRLESLQAVFEAEANAVNAGASAKVDFFLPLDAELPLRVT